MGPLFCIALALIFGLLSSRLMKFLKLPNVTGYLLSGIILGPYVLGPYIGGWSADSASSSTSLLSDISWISDVALGFIAFSIGSSFKMSTLKALGKRIVTITVFEALGGCFLTLLALFIAYAINPSIPIPVILTLGAIACATAPAATLMVIRQYNAKGPVVNTLLPVVAFDDAVALIMFSILFAISKSIAGGKGLNTYELIAVPLIEIFASLGIGVVLGLILTSACHYFKSRNNRMIWCCAMILSALGFSFVFKKYLDLELSSLLTCMMIGALWNNVSKDCEKTLDVLERFTPPLFMLFFVISGASLDLTIFNGGPLTTMVLIVGSIYIIARSIGKWFGSFLAAEITHAEPEVKKYLGFTLLPQAGVAIGLATTANDSFTILGFANEGALILAVILTATIIYELIGPVITKISLTKAGEIEKENKISNK